MLESLTLNGFFFLFFLADTADQRFLAVTDLKLADNEPDVFDVVVSDGTHKVLAGLLFSFVSFIPSFLFSCTSIFVLVQQRKCVLSTKYNLLAKKGGLDGQTVSVSSLLVFLFSE